MFDVRDGHASMEKIDGDLFVGGGEDAAYTTPLQEGTL
jgi:hypothetical protein